MIDLIKLLAIFALIVLLLRRRLNLGLTMLVGSVSLALAYRLSPASFVQAAVAAAIAPATLNLILALLLIMALENVMRRTKMLGLMVDSLGRIVPDRRVVMALLPALFGLLPSAGGARFSAPMVDEASHGLDLSPERKSFINYWYRHIWEFTFPLYPSLILGAQILGMSLGDLISLLFPFTFVAILAGAPFAFRGLGSAARAVSRAGAGRAYLRDMIWGMSPILAVTLLVVGLRVDASVALGLTVVGLLLWHRYTPRGALEMAREAFSVNIVAMVVATMVFKEVLLRSGVLDTLPTYLATVGVPSVIAVFTIPFLIGLGTGYAQAPVAVGFPIVAGLLTGAGVDVGLIVLAFVGGFGGVMLSPAHLCLILTVDHFRANAGQVLRLVLVPELVVMLAAAGAVYVF